jgi:hypothetical protein
MAQYITTISQGISSLHLCHQGRTVFSSHTYMTGGSLVPGVIFQNGQLRDARQPGRVLGMAELARHLHLPVVSRWQRFRRVVHECLAEWTLPLRKGKDRRWNPLLE